MSFKVTIQPSGHQFSCEPTQTVLEAALKHGFAFPYGCRNGSCGACMGKLLAGDIAYGDGAYVDLTLQSEAADKALFCQAMPRTDLTIEVGEIGAARDIQIKTLPVRVQRLVRLADDVMALYLKLPATQRMPFLAGQYLDILLKNGKRRSFSMANAPHDDELIELHVRRVEGGYFTSFVFEQLKEKDLLRIEGPHGSFFFDEESDKPIIAMAGGTGLAPIKSILEHMVHTENPRPVHLFWGVRRQRDLYLPDLPGELQQQLPQLRYTPVLSEPEPDWAGERGWVHEAVLRHYPDLSAYEVYTCGPPPMIEAARPAFAAAGLPAAALRFDAFDFAGD